MHGGGLDFLLPLAQNPVPGGLTTPGLHSLVVRGPDVQGEAPLKPPAGHLQLPGSSTTLHVPRLAATSLGLCLWRPVSPCLLSSSYKDSHTGRCRRSHSGLTARACAVPGPPDPRGMLRAPDFDLRAPLSRSTCPVASRLSSSLSSKKHLHRQTDIQPTAATRRGGWATCTFNKPLVHLFPVLEDATTSLPAKTSCGLAEQQGRGLRTPAEGPQVPASRPLSP